MSSLRKLSVSSSLTQPVLLLGGERMPVVITFVLFFIIILSDISILKTILGFVFLSISLALLRLMAKIDPQLIRIYLRRLQYQPFYPAFSRAIR